MPARDEPAGVSRRHHAGRSPVSFSSPIVQRSACALSVPLHNVVLPHNAASTHNVAPPHNVAPSHNAAPLHNAASSLHAARRTTQSRRPVATSFHRVVSFPCSTGESHDQPLRPPAGCAARAAVYVWGACTGLAAAQAYPAKPIQLIVPFSAGGDADMAARNLAAAAQGLLGQPVVVVNKAGANGAIGSAAVKQAAPDGYTLLLGRIGSQVLLPALQPKTTPYGGRFHVHRAAGAEPGGLRGASGQRLPDAGRSGERGEGQARQAELQPLRPGHGAEPGAAAAAQHAGPEAGRGGQRAVQGATRWRWRC